MKNKNYLWFTFFILYTFLLIGCDSFTLEKENIERIAVFRIAPNFISDTLYVENHQYSHLVIDYMDITEMNSKQIIRLPVKYSKYNIANEIINVIEIEEIEMIEGFKYTTGYLFIIKVLISKKDHFKRIADGFQETYKLIEIQSISSWGKNDTS